MAKLVFGGSARFTQVVTRLDQYAASDWPILLLGETGVGKEVLARRAHGQSARRLGPFIPVNCGALPANLVESELFGHERGAFSGAEQSTKGLVRLAHGGTLFLDEIGEMEPMLQVKLLRFLDSQEVRAVGSTRIEKVDTRIIAATNAELHRRCGEGRFRRDLLERLAVLTIEIPPLRERPEDIPGLVGAVQEELRFRIDAVALAAIGGYSWPGNVRQLRNFLVRASVTGRNEVGHHLVDRLLKEEIAWASRSEEPAVDDLGNVPLAEIEKRVIVARLNRCHGNRKQTAKELGIAKSTLHEKLRRWQDERARDGAVNLAGVAS